MKRSILISLMVIGAVSAMISGATFSAFTDSEVATGTLTTGNVNVTLDQAGTFTFAPDCEGPIGSEEECTAEIAVTYGGPNSLPASLDLDLDVTDTGSCFAVTLAWSGGASDSTSPYEVSVPAAASGTVSITVAVADLNQEALDACQDATISLTLTVTATEITS